MILAYLRNPDFIKPDYPNGLKSRLREELFIKAAALEFTKEMNLVNLSTLNTYFSCAKTEKVKKELLDSIYEVVGRIEGVFSFQFGPTQHRKLENSRDKMAKAVELLSKKGMLSESTSFTLDQVHAIIEEYRNNKDKK
jgi:hypothetical protein